MPKTTVVQFISDMRATGKTDSEITHELLDAGWHMDIISKAMHGEPIKQRELKPILDIKKQPYRKTMIAGLIILVLLGAMLIALYI